MNEYIYTETDWMSREPKFKSHKFQAASNEEAWEIVKGKNVEWEQDGALVMVIPHPSHKK